ncbi:MAG TPA: signal peptide peptidase SppA [Kofleriaceae bacterium]|nr:signal peptide peptidase SppA [Kofleriaceae bacterium]
MGALRTIVCAAALTACADHPSPLDKAVGEAKRGATDPWSEKNAGSPPAEQDTDAGDAFGGVDIKEMLQKVATALETPGPYEAPEKSANYDETKPHWGVLGMGGSIVERQAFSFSFMGGGGGSGKELREVVERLREFAKDDKLTGILLRVESIDVSLPDVIELRTAMHDFRKAGKKLVCHTEEASNATYLVLAACERIGLAPLGTIAITGPAAMPIHVKPLLDKLGVTADFLHVGAYKGAAEPLTREAPSAEMRETLQGILDRHYATTVDIIAKERKLASENVQALVDTALFPSPHAKAAKLVDDVVSFEAFRDANLAAAAWTELEYEPPASKDQLKAMLKVARFLGAMPPERPIGPHVAVVYALGNIVDGDGDGVLGARQEIASHTMVAAIRALAKDDAVKAVVLRIDSGGGSAQASELIWEAVAQLKAKKPVIVSMSDVAASGGYYIASGATKIFAQEDTLTGSIGVVGGKIAPGNALAKLGVNTFPMGKGKRATMMSSLSPWTAEEKQVIQSSMDDVYKTFVGRVADGRKKKLEDVLPIAQGRVWTGAKAKELGLVDEIGGLDAALAEAQKLAKIEPTADLEIYPPAPTLRDFFQGFSTGVSTGLFGSELAALRALDPRVADAAESMLALVMSFQKTKIQAVAVLPVIR